MSNLQTYYHFKLDFQKVDQHAGGKWLTHGTKRRKDNPKETCSIQYSRRMPRGGNIQGDVHLQKQKYLDRESPKCSSKSNEWP